MSDIPSTCAPFKRADTNPCCCGSDLAGLYKALGHPARIDILRVLSTCDHACCGEIVSKLSLAQSTISQHLNVLKCAGLIGCEAKGRCCRYYIRSDALRSFAALSRTLMETLDTAVSGHEDHERQALTDDNREADCPRKEKP
ncbi:helix-turn-helix transcriptional regulator [Rhizobiales bacterium]|uniref:ArsR/SmtB family transcription factor n=1 Tax=Hongsoonwoonella zoysiae TaxID=2821844 RepID=UPI00155F98BB|nr:metalloregulator ArsR/SmtB family transcription factor [Hongsoonwoonella zoysiae]NRG19042.1 helix-turn-helix transcriptional regulator [Hongsoonwoonella zoysiae]